MPSEVCDARAVPGLHLVHTAAALDGFAVVERMLLAQPLGVIARMVHAPAASVAAAFSLDGALAYAGMLGLPVLVPGNALAEAGGDRVLPVDGRWREAAPGTAEYVLVLPGVHVLMRSPIAGMSAGWNVRQVLLGGGGDVAAAAYSGGFVSRVGDVPWGLLRLGGGVTTAGDRFQGPVAAARGIAAARLDSVGPLGSSGRVDASLGRDDVGVFEDRLGVIGESREVLPPPGSHEDPGSVAVWLPSGGLMLLDPEMVEQVAAARSFRAAVDEYPVFVHGSPHGAMVGGFRVSPRQLAAVIEADPLSVGKTVVLVQCGGGETSGVVNDYAARLFAVLTATPRVFGMGGRAWVQPLPSGAEVGEVSEVRVARTVVHADGRVRLSTSGGVREYVPASGASQAAGRRVAKVIQHGPTLSAARHGVGVALTDDLGVLLSGEHAPTPAALHALGLSAAEDPTTAPSTGGVSFSYPDPDPGLYGQFVDPAGSSAVTAAPSPISRRYHTSLRGRWWVVYDVPAGYSLQELEQMVTVDSAIHPAGTPALVSFSFADDQQVRWALNQGMYVVYLRIGDLAHVLAHQSMPAELRLDAVYVNSFVPDTDAVIGLIENSSPPTAVNTVDTTMTDVLTDTAAPNGSFHPMITNPDQMMMNPGQMMNLDLGLGQRMDLAPDSFWLGSGQSDPYPMAHTPWLVQDMLSGQWTTPPTDPTWTTHDPLSAGFMTHPPTSTASTSAVPDTTAHHHTDPLPLPTGPMSMFELRPPTSSDEEHHVPPHHHPDHDEDHNSLFDDDEDHNFLFDEPPSNAAFGYPLPALPSAGPSTTASTSAPPPPQQSRQRPSRAKPERIRNFTAQERADAIKAWVAKDPHNHRNAIPISREQVEVKGKKYPVGNILYALTKIGSCRDEPVIETALRDAGFEVSSDGDGHMHIVNFRRMSDDSAADFIAVYDVWLSEKNAEGKPVNIGQMPRLDQTLPHPTKQGKIVNFGRFMHSIKSYGHSDPTGDIALMLEFQSGFTILRSPDRESGFDGFVVPGEPPRKPRKLTAKQEQASQKRIEVVKNWVGDNGQNAGKVPSRGETAKDNAGRSHPIGQWFSNWRRKSGIAFHAGLYELLKDKGFEPEHDKVRDKIFLPRDKGALASTVEKEQEVEDLFTAYDLWRAQKPEERAKKIPPESEEIRLPGMSTPFPLGVRMRDLVRLGRVDPQGTIGERLRARGLTTDTQVEKRNGKTVTKTRLVHPRDAPAEAEPVSVSAAMQQTAIEAVGHGGGRPPRQWAMASGSGGQPVVSEPVILPPGVEQRPGQPGLYWVGPRTRGKGRLETAGATASSAGHPHAQVIMLSRDPDEHQHDEDLRQLRRLTQQFTLQQRPTLVITVDPVSASLTRIARDFHVDILHLVTGSATGHGTASTTPTANLDNIWQSTKSNGDTTNHGKKLTSALFTRTADHLTPPPPVTPALAKLLLTHTAHDKISVLNEYRGHLNTPQARAELDTIITANDNDHWFSSARPLLGVLGTPAYTPLFLDYHTAAENPTQRHQILLRDDARTLNVDERVQLIRDTGHPTDSAQAAMTAVDILFTHGEAAALQHVRDNTTHLNTTARYNWVDAIAALHTQHPDQRTQLHNLSTAIYDCGPHHNDPHQ